MKTQLLDQVNHVPTKEGLTVELDVAVLYHVKVEEIRSLYLKLGLEFREVVMKPEIASAVRGLTSESEAKALYTAGRLEMQKKPVAHTLTWFVRPMFCMVLNILT